MNNCTICDRQNEKSFVVYEDHHWIVRHSSETNIVGYFLIESRRHFLDLGSATDAETETYGRVLNRISAAMRSVLQCERIYSFSLAEAVPHYHLHLIPRAVDFPRRYKGRGIMQYPLTPVVDPALMQETCLRTRNALKRVPVLR